MKFLQKWLFVLFTDYYYSLFGFERLSPDLLGNLVRADL